MKLSPWISGRVVLKSQIGRKNKQMRRVDRRNQVSLLINKE